MISIIVPSYNEERRLYSTIKNLVKWLMEKKITYELIIADDNSTDKTSIIAKKLLKENNRIKFLSSSIRLGRGATLSKIIKIAQSNYIIYLDADMSTNITALTSLVEFIQKGYDIVSGSRYHYNSKIKRTQLRYFLSKVYNFLLRSLFLSSMHDHQCGFKAFQKNKILSLLPKIRSVHWFWDSELLIKAQKKGLKIKEIPIEWKEMAGTKVNLLKDISEMLLGIIVLWIDIHVKKFY